jgi:hypothetical protein
MALTARQDLMARASILIANKVGEWDKGIGADGAHYVPASANPDAGRGLICANCVFYRGVNGCGIVRGEIEPKAVCRLYIIPEERLAAKSRLSGRPTRIEVVK